MFILYTQTQELLAKGYAHAMQGSMGTDHNHEAFP